MKITLEIDIIDLKKYLEEKYYYGEKHISLSLNEAIFKEDRTKKVETDELPEGHFEPQETSFKIIKIEN